MSLKQSFFALLAFFLVSITQANYSWSAADDCSNVDLNEPKDSPFRSIPIYDQDGTETCYAHGSVELIDYWLLKNGGKPSDLINPMYASWLNSYGARNFLTSGSATSGGGSVLHNIVSGGNSVGDISSDLKFFGYCKNDQVESCLSDFKKMGKMTDAELVHYLELLYTNYSMFNREHSSKKAIGKAVVDDWLYGGCNVNKISEGIISKNLMGVSSNKILGDLFKKCKPLTQLTTIPKPTVYQDRNDSDLQKNIDQALTKKLPLAIGFCATVLDNHNYRGLKGKSAFLSSMINRGSNGNLKSDCGGHEAMLTARKKISGECKYLVRNSWGAFWSPHGIDCACIDQDGSYEDICKSYNPKEYVGCWYKRKDLIPNITDAATL